MSTNYPIYAHCSHCGVATDLVCGDGTGRHYCSGQCCSDRQAILDHDPVKLQEVREMQAEAAEFNEESNWWNHQDQCDGGLL